MQTTKGRQARLALMKECDAEEKEGEFYGNTYLYSEVFCLSRKSTISKVLITQRKQQQGAWYKIVREIEEIVRAGDKY